MATVDHQPLLPPYHSGGWGGYSLCVGFVGSQLPLLLLPPASSHMALLAIYRVPGPVLILFYTHTQGGPRPDGERLWPGERELTEGAHRTLKDIEALYRFGLPGGRLNAKRRRASPHIASSRQPAIPPGNGSISRSLDPSFQRSPDTRRRQAQNR